MPAASPTAATRPRSRRAGGEDGAGFESVTDGRWMLRVFFYGNCGCFELRGPWPGSGRLILAANI